MRKTAGTSRSHSGLLSVVVALGVIVIPSVPLSADVLQCGDVITRDVTLEADLACQDHQDGLIIGASEVTVDLGGHTIYGPGDSLGGAGIVNEGHRHVTIRNGAINGFFLGVHLLGASESTVEDLVLERIAVSGISLYSASGNTVRRITSRANAAWDPFQWVSVSESDHNEIVSNTFTRALEAIRVARSSSNTVARNSTSGAWVGIALEYSDTNEITSNTIIDGRYEGIRLSSSSGNSVTANTITDMGDLGDGVSLIYDSDMNDISQNTVSRAQRGITVEGGGVTFAEGNVVDRNRLSENAGVGIHILGNTAGAEVTRNVITGNGHTGIEVEAGSSGIWLAFNKTDRNGTAGQWDGIRIQAAGTTVAKNKAFFNSGYGISAVPGVVDAGGNRAKHNDAGQCLNIECK